MRLRRRSASAAVDQPQLQICGDDFTDVSDDHSLSTPPPPPPVSKPQTSDCHVNDFLLKRGFGFNRDKLADCLRQLEDSGYNVRQKVSVCIQKFRFSDLNSCGGGILPNDLHLQTFLHGPYVLQVSISIFIILLRFSAIYYCCFESESQIHNFVFLRRCNLDEFVFLV